MKRDEIDITESVGCGDVDHLRWVSNIDPKFDRKLLNFPAPDLQTLFKIREESENEMESREKAHKGSEILPQESSKDL